MEVKYPRRILVVGAPGSGVLEVIKELTGTAPEPHTNGSTAGLTHEWHIKTAYYEAKVPIWVDEIAEIQEWKAEFMKPEAKEVVEAVGAWIICFAGQQIVDKSEAAEETMKAIQEISEEHAGYGAEGVMLAVAVPRTTESTEAMRQGREEWEDCCMQYGFEFIDCSLKTTEKNEFGEATGIERMKEALEANEWTGTGPSDEDELDLDFLGSDDEMGGRGLARDEADMTAELFGMKAALTGNDFEPDADDFDDQEHEVEDLDRMMGKLLAVKEQSAGLPEQQRKMLAAKAVRELLSENIKK